MYACYDVYMRTTITLNDTIYKTLKIHAAQTDTTVSAIVEDAIKEQILEDLYDAQEVEKRKNNPLLPFDDLVKEFKAKGLL